MNKNFLSFIIITTAWVLLAAYSVSAQTFPFSQEQLDIPKQLQDIIDRFTKEQLEALEKTDSVDVEIVTETLTPLPSANVVLIAAFPHGGNPDNAIFRWSVDGKKVLEGVGERRLTLQNKTKLGEQTTVTVTVLFTDHKPITKTAILTVADALVAFKSGTYVPPGYQGLNLPTISSPVTVGVGALFGVQQNMSILKYSWNLNGQLLAEGINRRNITFNTEAGAGRTNELKLEITNPPDDTIKIIKKIVIPLATPEVYLYPADKRFQVISDHTIATGERGELVALPYFFTGPIANLQFNWQFLSQNSQGKGEEASKLRYTGPSSAELPYLRASALRLNVRNPSGFGQSADLVVPMRFK